MHNIYLFFESRIKSKKKNKSFGINILLYGNTKLEHNSNHAYTCRLLVKPNVVNLCRHVDISTYLCVYMVREQVVTGS